MDMNMGNMDMGNMNMDMGDESGVANDGNFWWSIGYLGHIVPAIPLYVYGFLIASGAMNDDTSSRKQKYIGSACAIFIGLFYAAIELSMAITADTPMQLMSSLTHTNVGFGIALGGFLYFMFLHWPGTSSYCYNVGLASVFIFVALSLSFHDHMHADGSEDVSSNRIHLAFALGMIATGVLEVLSRTWTMLSFWHGLFAIYSSLVLTSISPFVIDPVVDHHIGIGNLVMYCIFLTALHAIGILFYKIYNEQQQQSGQYEYLSQRDDL